LLFIDGNIGRTAMPRLDRVMNRKIVRRLFNYYTTKGSRRIDELFGAEKEHGIKALLTRFPLETALNRAMKVMNVTEEMKALFFTSCYNKQALKNVMKTVAAHGMQQPFRFDSPLVVVWNYTNLCNLRCRYCYQSAGKPKEDELTFEEKIDLINQMVDANVAFLAFSGGEPIMGDRFWDLLDYASKFLHTSLASNGTLLGDRRTVQKLADHGLKNVFISLDGATAASHDFIRGTGNFERSLRGIANCVDDPHLHTGINMVVTRRNLDEVPAVLELAQELSVNSFNHYNFIPTGRGKEDRDLDLTPEEREELLNLLSERHAQRHETGLNIISTAPQFARVIWELSNRRSGGLFHYTADNATNITGIIEYAGGCGAGRVYAAVQPNGRMTPCVFMPDVTIGSVREERFIDIWQRSETCIKMVDRDNYHYQCPEYRHICGGCRARAYAYGDLIGPDPKCAVYQQVMQNRERADVERRTGVEAVAV
jgi:radical SAM protein with 4Fe4S-binding SPASM domain